MQLEAVTKRYGKEEALRAVSFTMDTGTIGLLGPNGAGKSTLIKVLLGLLHFDGQALVFGLDPRVKPAQVRSRVGYMPEGECYLAGMTAIDLCTYAGELSGLPRTEAMDRAHQALGYVGLGDKRYQKVDGYSTGMKQKVKLAQAIVHDPDLLLLDEPTAGLDPRGREEMLQLIADIPRKRGGAMVLSSHLLADIESVCEQVIVLSRGELRFAGLLAELRAGEMGTYLVRIKGEPEAFLRALAAAGCEARPGDDGALRVRLPAGGDTSAILRAAVSAGVQVRRLEAERRTLEAAFLQAVGGHA
ncbi:MAG TPA: ABC transporter ATP-binding protein [Polyangia bacterium]|nr:ABC transporter ATP-binding protein [Polyangia bacterium]